MENKNKELPKALTIEDLKNNPSDTVVRTSVLNSASSLSDYLNNIESKYVHCN